MRIASTIGATSVQHDGIDYEAGEDGLFEVPQAVGEELVRFDIWETETAAAKAAADAQHEANLDPENLAGRVADLEADVEELRGTVAKLEGLLAEATKPAPAPAKKAPAKAPAKSGD
jgi:hypothetical protein